MTATGVNPNTRVAPQIPTPTAEARRQCWWRLHLSGWVGFGVCLAACLTGATMASAQLVDGFETYADTADLLTEWSFAELDDTTPTPFGTKSLLLSDLSSPDGSGRFSARTLPERLDISQSDTFEAWVRLDPISVGPVLFSVAIRDADGPSCSSQGQPLVSDSDWHKISIDLAQFCLAVNLQEIEEVSVSITNMSGGSGDLIGNFDVLNAPLQLFSDGFEVGNTSAWGVP